MCRAFYCLHLPHRKFPLDSQPGNADEAVRRVGDHAQRAAAGPLEITPNELLLGTSQNMTDYLQTEVQQKLMLCTPSERRLVDRFIDLLLDERNHRQ